MAVCHDKIKKYNLSVKSYKDEFPSSVRFHENFVLLAKKKSLLAYVSSYAECHSKASVASVKFQRAFTKIIRNILATVSCLLLHPERASLHKHHQERTLSQVVSKKKRLTYLLNDISRIRGVVRRRSPYTLADVNSREIPKVFTVFII